MKKKRRSYSLLIMLLAPLLLIMVVQAALYYFTTLWGNVIPQIQDNAFVMLEQRVTGRKNYLESNMIRQWSTIEDTVNSLNKSMDKLVQQYGSVQAVLSSPVASAEYLENTANTVLYTLRKNMVTGAFVVLDSTSQTDLGLGRPGIYIANPDPTTTSSDNSDLLVLRGSTNICRNLGITTDLTWTPMFTFTEENSRFYDMPAKIARERPELALEDKAYWCDAFPLDAGGDSVITYSLPLIDSSGNLYGVVGVELSVEYLQTLLPYREISQSGQASYCLAVTRDQGHSYRQVARSNRRTATGEPPLLSDDLIIAPYAGWDTVNQVSNSNVGTTLLAQLSPLRLYNPDNPFVDEQWALVGLIDKDDLMSFPSNVNRTALLTTVLAMGLGIVIAIVIVRQLTSPIHALVKQLRASNPHHPVVLGAAGIAEIDELTQAIADLSLRVSQSSSTLSRIINIANIAIGAFELDRTTNYLVVTDQFFSVMGMPQPSSPSQYSMTSEQFKEQFSDAALEVEETLPNGWILRVVNDKKTPRWVRLTLVDETTRLLGVAVDITVETLNQRRIEYERDYDLLTNLLNRRAFLSITQKLFEQPQNLRVSAMLMLDLDNLKYINDSYGHDCGDSYIQATANALRRMPVQNMILARMSGDEFFLFLYGFEKQEELRTIIQGIKEEIGNSHFILPGAETVKIRCSAGIAWYPENADTVDQLLRYADFAMYTAKNSKKGDFCEFNSYSYQQNAYLLHSREELNKLIDGCLVTYRFQPIVDALTGQVFAYEALMRPTLDTLTNPLEVLSLARNQSKLYDIERITWFTALQQVKSDPCFTNGNAKLFINSVSNQILTDEDIDAIKLRFAPLLNRVVLEVTEEERFTEDLTSKKQGLLYSWGGEIALDDFGTGYNGDSALLLLTPDYVKIDMSIVRGIDTDSSRQGIFRNLVSYSHERSIKVIAEGIETFQEMQCLIELGADYLQGYFLGLPDLEIQTIAADLSEEIVNIAKGRAQ